MHETIARQGVNFEGIEVDDDDDPAPENVPGTNEAGPENIFSDNWGFGGLDF